MMIMMIESICQEEVSERVTPSAPSILTSSRNSVQIFGLSLKRCLKCCLILSGLQNKMLIIDILLKIIFFRGPLCISLLELSRTDLGLFSPQNWAFVTELKFASNWLLFVTSFYLICHKHLQKRPWNTCESRSQSRASGCGSDFCSC